MPVVSRYTASAAQASGEMGRVRSAWSRASRACAIRSTPGITRPAAWARSSARRRARSAGAASKHHRADVSALHDDAALVAIAALALDQHRTHRGMARHGRRRIINLGRPNGRRHVIAVNHDSVVEVERRASGDRGHRFTIGQVHAVLARLPGHAPVHRASVQVPVVQPIGNRSGDGAFSRARRSVDSDDEGARHARPFWMLHLGWAIAIMPACLSV
jgi:hypothetical protein